MFWLPLKVRFFCSKLLLYNCKFHSIKDEQLDTITSLTLLMLTLLPSLCLISYEQTVSSVNAFVAPLGLKLSWHKTKLQNVGVDPGGWGPDPWKYVGGVRVCFHPPLKCHILSFKTVVVQLQVSQHQGWTVGHYHFTELAHADDANILMSLTSLCLISSKQTVSSNQCLCCSTTGLKVIMAQDKTSKRAGDPSSTILIDGVPVEGVEEFIYLGSKQSSNGYCRLDVLRRNGLACSVMNSLQRVWNCSSLGISTKVHLFQALIRSVLL